MGREEVSIETGGGIVVGQEREIRKREELCTVQYTAPEIDTSFRSLLFSFLFFRPPPLSLFSSDFDDVKIQIGIQLDKNA